MFKRTNLQILLAFILVFSYSILTQNYERINKLFDSNNLGINYSFFISIILFLLFIINFKIIRIDYKFKPLKYNQNTNNQLLTIRFLACVSVIIFHVKIWRLSSLDTQNYFLNSILNFNGESAVYIFFILSGFLMGKNFLNYKYELNTDGIIKFYKNRMIQIFPIYYLVIFITIFWDERILGNFDIETINTILRYLTFSDVIEAQPCINGTLWSIANEILFYLLSPFICIFLQKIFNKYNFVGIFIIFFILSIFTRTILLCFSSNHRLFIYQAFYANWDLFTFGVLLNFVIDRFYNSFKKIPSNLLINLTIFLIFLYSNFTSFKISVKSAGNVFVIMFLVGITIVLIEIRGIMHNKNKKITFFQKLGIYTYCTYLLSVITTNTFSNLINKIPNCVLLKYFLFILGALSIGALFYYLIERPICKLYKKSVIKNEFKE